MFQPTEHLIQLKSRDGNKDYLPVQWRLVWVNDVVDRAVADGQQVSLEIETEEVACDLDKEFSAEVFVWNNEKKRSEKVVKQACGYAKYKAIVTLQIGNMVKRASATKSERAVDFPDYVEKANTGAVGRALAMIGFGTQFTGPELDEGTARIVDAPVERNTTPAAGRASDGNNAPSENADASITEQQLASIRKLCQHIGKSEPANVAAISFLAAKRLIQQLTAEYRETRQPGKAS